MTNLNSSVNIYIVDAVVAELADALDLGSSVFDVGVQVLSTAPITNLFELQIQKSISKMVDFFVCEKIILKERMVSVMKIIKQEIQFEESLKQRLEFICEFSKVSPTFIKGSIRKIEKTNLSYIEPHKVIVKNITLLVFNYSNDVYISNLSKKIKLSELETYLKNI